MKVLLVNGTALEGAKGGMARSIETLGSGLARQIQVLPFVPGPWSQHKPALFDGPLGREYRMAVPLPYGEGNPLWRYAAWAARFPAALLNARGLMRHERIDLVQTTFHSENILFWLLKRLVGLPYVVTLHGSDAVYFDRVPPAHRRLAGLVIRGADAVVTVSEEIRRVAERRFGVNLPLIRIYNGIDAEATRRAAEACIPSGMPARYIVAVGSLTPVKGHDVLLRAWAGLASRFPDVSLVIVGDGQEKLRYRELAAQLGIAHRVLWTGWLEHRAALGVLSHALVHVLPSRSEGLSYSILEAGACDVPTVASNIGGIPEVITHKESGWLVTPEDPDALRVAINECLTHPTEARMRANALLNKVKTIFTVNDMVNGYLRIYRDIVGRAVDSAGRGVEGRG